MGGKLRRGLIKPERRENMAAKKKAAKKAAPKKASKKK